MPLEKVFETIQKGLEMLAVWLANAKNEKQRTVREGKKAVVRAQIRRRLSRFKDEFKQTKFNYDNDESRKLLAGNLGMDTTKPVTDASLNNRIRHISLESLMQKDAMMPGTLVNAFVQKVENEKGKTVMKQMNYGSLFNLKEKDSLHFDLTRNWSVYNKTGFKEFFKYRPDIFQIYVRNTYRGRSGLAQKNPKNGNFYFVRPDGSQGGYAEIFKGFVEIVKIVPPEKQDEESKDMAAATKKRAALRRQRLAAQGTPGEYKATPEKQKEFEQMLKEIQETTDREKLMALAKKYRTSANDSETIVVYPGKTDTYGRPLKARRNTLLVYACFEQSLKILNDKKGTTFKLTVVSAFRTVAKQREIRKRTEEAYMQSVTDEYKQKFKKQHPAWDDARIQKELEKPAVKAKITREALRRASYIAAKATKSHHLTGGALDIRVTEGDKNLTNYTFKIDYNKNQTPSNFSKAVRGDKAAYALLTKHNKATVRAAKYLIEKTGIRDFYPPSTELTSELWHKNIGRGVYRAPELVAASQRPRSSAVAGREPANLPMRPEIKEKAPEDWPPSLVAKAIDIPSHRLYCTLIRPKEKPKAGQSVIIMPFFTGKFRSNPYTRFRERSGAMKPPAHIAELVAKKYLLDKDKRQILAWQMEMAKQGKYVVIAYLSEIHTGATNPGSMWYHDFKQRYLGGKRNEDMETVYKRVNDIFDAIRDNVARDVDKEPERGMFLAGTSMGGLPIKYITQYIKDGKLPLKLDGIFSSDSTYWLVYETCKFVKQTGTPWLVSFRRDSGTADQAKQVINFFQLRKRKHPNGHGWIYVNPQYPQVVVRESTPWGVSHGAHPSYFLPEAWENSRNNIPS